MDHSQNRQGEMKELRHTEDCHSYSESCAQHMSDVCLIVFVPHVKLNVVVCHSVFCFLK